jgi:hypothetical protein
MMQRNSCKLLSRKSTDMWIVTTGPSRKEGEVPDDVQIVPSVWSMQRKRDLTTNKIKSHKAQLNLHGRKQIYGMKYFETYAPVVT